MKFKGTIVAVVVILLLVIITKFGFGEDFSRKEVIVEPTEPPTMGFIGGTRIEVAPTE